IQSRDTGRVMFQEHFRIRGLASSVTRTASSSGSHERDDCSWSLNQVTVFSVRDRELARAVAIEAHRDDHPNRGDAAVPAPFDVGGVDPQIGAVALDRTYERLQSSCPIA